MALPTIEMKIEPIQHGIFQYFICFESSNPLSLREIMHKLSDSDCQNDDNFIVFEDPLNETQMNDSVQPKNKGKKHVKFDLKPTVHEMHVWKFAYKQARKDEWQKAARDRNRFTKKIAEMGKIIEPILKIKLKKILEKLKKWKFYFQNLEDKQ